jgi:NLE (NUC135) domain/WD domain, G-beta repeat
MGGLELANGASAAAAAAAPPKPAPPADDVPIRLVAGVADAALRGADGAELTVPSRMGRKALRDLVQHLLGLADDPTAPRPDFHFLAPGGVALRTTLAKFIARRGLSTEAALVLTYYLALPEPERPEAVCLSNDWLADVAIYEGWGGGAVPLLLVGSYSGCPAVSTPGGVLVAEEAVRGAAHRAPVKGVAWLADGQGFVTASHDETVQLWAYRHGVEAAACGAEVCGVFRAAEVASGVCFESVAATSRGGKDLVALGASNGSLWMLEEVEAARSARDAGGTDGKRKGVEVAEISARQLGVCSADLSVASLRWRGDELVSAGLDGMVRVWDPDSAVVKLSIPGGGKSLTGLTHSEQSFLVSAADGVVRLLDAREGKGVVGSSSRGKGHAGMATDVAWIVQDASFASGGLDGSVRAWDMRAFDAPVHVVEGVHGKGARSLSLECCTYEGRATVFSAGEDGRLQPVSFSM